MIFDQKKPKVQRPNDPNKKGELELKDRSQEVPKVAEVVSEIDRLLQKTRPRSQRDGCGCGW